VGFAFGLSVAIGVSSSGFVISSGASNLTSVGAGDFLEVVCVLEAVLLVVLTVVSEVPEVSVTSEVRRPESVSGIELCASS
jgi:hypothetical protein